MTGNSADASLAARQAMVDSQLMPCGVVEPRLVDALLAVPRERFVAPARAGLAYAEAAQPIAPGRFLPVPLTTGRLLARANPQAGEHVLLLGAGTGYAAAVMAEMGAAVVALESDPALAAIARQALVPFPGARMLEGPLEEGAPDHAPFDLILIDAAVEVIPTLLEEQLKPEGRAVLVLLSPDGIHRAGIGRRSTGGLSFDWFAESPAPLLPQFRADPAFRF
jgi:protein-L-isoaspartate(D-aspartate) O-methyltransferase